MKKLIIIILFLFNCFLFNGIDNKLLFFKTYDLTADYIKEKNMLIIYSPNCEDENYQISFVYYVIINFYNKYPDFYNIKNILVIINKNKHIVNPEWFDEKSQTKFQQKNNLKQLLDKK